MELNYFAALLDRTRKIKGSSLDASFFCKIKKAYIAKII